MSASFAHEILNTKKYLANQKDRLYASKCKWECNLTSQKRNFLKSVLLRCFWKVCCRGFKVSCRSSMSRTNCSQTSCAVANPAQTRALIQGESRECFWLNQPVPSLRRVKVKHRSERPMSGTTIVWLLPDQDGGRSWNVWLNTRTTLISQSDSKLWRPN